METLFSLFARGILRLAGWRIVGEQPPLHKAVVVAAFHTTNWDGIMLVLAMMALRVHIVWIVKKELMWFPLGNAMRAMGALPIDRLGSQGVTDFLVAEFNRRDHMILVLSPEGTRHKVTRWRRGFYVIAERAHVPIVLAGIDYRRKVMGFGPSFVPSGDLDQDAEILRSFYKDFTPLHPENAGEIAFTRARDAVE